jgi:hypothetical protein
MAKRRSPFSRDFVQRNKWLKLLDMADEIRAVMPRTTRNKE